MFVVCDVLIYCSSIYQYWNENKRKCEYLPLNVNLSFLLALLKFEVGVHCAPDVSLGTVLLMLV